MGIFIYSSDLSIFGWNMHDMVVWVAAVFFLNTSVQYLFRHILILFALCLGLG